MKKLEKKIRDGFEKGDGQTRNKDSHVMSEAKEKEFDKICKAFGVNPN